MDPHGVRLSQSEFYCWLRVLRIPSSRELIILRNALKLMKNRGETLDAIEMNLLLCYPSCPQGLLKVILSTYLNCQ